MDPEPYDRNTAFYLDFVDRGLADPEGLPHQLMAIYRRLLEARVRESIALDIACGEGYLSRFLAQIGARRVTGVDISSNLVLAANQRSAGLDIAYRVDDAQKLITIADASVDIAVSQMALMDIPDHEAVFAAVKRVLKPSGLFAFTLLHPCFEGPFRLPEESQFQVDLEGTPVANVVRRYASEGYWESGGDGVRGKMGAHHRMLSTYINSLIASGFRITRIEEPLAASGLFAQVPRALFLLADVG
jgi:SAM-dependent methyltransferase